MITAEIFGTIALVTSIVGLLPQSYKALKTRSTHDISMAMLINYLICSVAWMIYGLCISSMFVLFSNVVCAASSMMLIFQKRHYDKQTIFN